MVAVDPADTAWVQEEDTVPEEEEDRSSPVAEVVVVHTTWRLFCVRRDVGLNTVVARPRFP